ncbi:hypothetical protein HDZ31DRAFT_69942 [Schizophyllum fasciatum]
MRFKLTAVAFLAGEQGLEFELARCRQRWSSGESKDEALRRRHESSSPPHDSISVSVHPVSSASSSSSSIDEISRQAFRAPTAASRAAQRGLGGLYWARRPQQRDQLGWLLDLGGAARGSQHVRSPPAITSALRPPPSALRPWSFVLRPSPPTSAFHQLTTLPRLLSIEVGVAASQFYASATWPSPRASPAHTAAALTLIAGTSDRPEHRWHGNSAGVLWEKAPARLVACASPRPP